jgi:hypothetical protein
LGIGYATSLLPNLLRGVLKPAGCFGTSPVATAEFFSPDPKMTKEGNGMFLNGAIH